jgi:hypothetical protein
MSATIHYRDSRRKVCQAVLQTYYWMKLRGTHVLRGQQRINGRLVNRSFAQDEIIKIEETK